MKKLVILGIISIGFLIVFSSCKKDDDDSKTKKEMITAKDWKYKSIISTVNGVSSDTIEDCIKDDKLSFKLNGTFTTDPGTSLCDGNEKPSDGTWTLTSDEKTLTIIEDNETTKLTVVSIKENEIILKNSVSEQGITVEMVMTFIPY